MNLKTNWSQGHYKQTKLEYKDIHDVSVYGTLLGIGAESFASVRCLNTWDTIWKHQTKKNAVIELCNDQHVILSTAKKEFLEWWNFRENVLIHTWNCATVYIGIETTSFLVVSLIPKSQKVSIEEKVWLCSLDGKREPFEIPGLPEDTGQLLLNKDYLYYYSSTNMMSVFDFKQSQIIRSFFLPSSENFAVGGNWIVTVHSKLKEDNKEKHFASVWTTSGTLLQTTEVPECDLLGIEADSLLLVDDLDNLLIFDLAKLEHLRTGIIIKRISKSYLLTFNGRFLVYANNGDGSLIILDFSMAESSTKQQKRKKQS